MLKIKSNENHLFYLNFFLKIYQFTKKQQTELLSCFFCFEQDHSHLTHLIQLAKQPETKNRSFQIQEYVLQKTLIVETIHKYLGNSETNFVCFNCKPSQSEPFILPLEKITKNCITVDIFVDIAINRFEEEINYNNEIIQIKDKVYSIFNDLSSRVNRNNNLCCQFIDDECKKIINKLFDATEIDYKQIAGEFLSNILNGFEDSLLQNINCFGNYLLFKPISTPLPIELCEIIQKKMQKIKGTPHILEDISSVVKKILAYIHSYLKPIKLASIKKLKNIQTLVDFLSMLTLERRQCILTIGIHDASMIQKVLRKEIRCVKLIRLSCFFRDFLQNSLYVYYNQLKIYNFYPSYKDQDLSIKFPEDLQRIKVRFKNLEIPKLKKMTCYLSRLFFLTEVEFDLRNFCITDKEVEQIAISLLEAQNLETIILDFRTDGEYNKICDKSIETLAKSLRNLNLIQKLTILISNGYNSYYQVSNVGLQHLAVSLKNKKLLKHIHLHFRSFCAFNNGNTISNAGVRELAKAIEDKHDMSKISLIFVWNNVGDNGIKALALAIEKMHQLKHLQLDFSRPTNQNDPITSEGIRFLISSIKNKFSIQFVSLNFSGNTIDNNSIQALKYAFKNLELLKKLELNY